MKKKRSRRLLKRALARKDILMDKVKVIYETFDFLEEVYAEMRVKEAGGDKHSERQWISLTEKCAWEQRRLDSYEAELDYLTALVKQPKGRD